MLSDTNRLLNESIPPKALRKFSPGFALRLATIVRTS